MLDKTITLFNHYVEDGKDKYKRTVIKGVHFEGLLGSQFSNQTEYDNGSLFVSIPLNIPGYLNPKQFLEDTQNSWTLKSNDFIVKGEVEDISSIKKLKEFEDYYKIVSVEVFDYAKTSKLNHFEVIAK